MSGGPCVCVYETTLAAFIHETNELSSSSFSSSSSRHKLSSLNSLLFCPIPTTSASYHFRRAAVFFRLHHSRHLTQTAKLWKQERKKKERKRQIPFFSSVRAAKIRGHLVHPALRGTHSVPLDFSLLSHAPLWVSRLLGVAPAFLNSADVIAIVFFPGVGSLRHAQHDTANKTTDTTLTRWASPSPMSGQQQPQQLQQHHQQSQHPHQQQTPRPRYRNINNNYISSSNSLHRGTNAPTGKKQKRNKWQLQLSRNAELNFKFLPKMNKCRVRPSRKKETFAFKDASS